MRKWVAALLRKPGVARKIITLKPVRGLQSDDIIIKTTGSARPKQTTKELSKKGLMF
jgi:hypothetical protein